MFPDQRVFSQLIVPGGKVYWFGFIINVQYIWLIIISGEVGDLLYFQLYDGRPYCICGQVNVSITHYLPASPFVQ